MTRDEAIAIAKHSDGRLKHTSNSFAEDIVNILIALGMLKLDEPRGIVGVRFDDAMKGLPQPCEYRDVWNAIHAADLKIVEK